MVQVSVLVLAQKADADWNGNADIRGTLSSFRLSSEKAVSGDVDSWVQSAAGGFGSTAVVTFWAIPPEDQGCPYEGRIDVAWGGQIAAQIALHPIDTSAHYATWIVQLPQPPLFGAGRHELLASARRVDTESTAWTSPLAAYPYVVEVVRTPAALPAPAG